MNVCEIIVATTSTKHSIMSVIERYVPACFYVVTYVYGATKYVRSKLVPFGPHLRYLYRENGNCIWLTWPTIIMLL